MYLALNLFESLSMLDAHFSSWKILDPKNCKGSCKGPVMSFSCQQQSYEGFHDRWRHDGLIIIYSCNRRFLKDWDYCGSQDLCEDGCQLVRTGGWYTIQVQCLPDLLSLKQILSANGGVSGEGWGGGKGHKWLLNVEVGEGCECGLIKPAVKPSRNFCSWECAKLCSSPNGHLRPPPWSDLAAWVLLSTRVYWCCFCRFYSAHMSSWCLTKDVTMSEFNQVCSCSLKNTPIIAVKVSL